VMGVFGYAIEQTLITDIEPDATVKKSMNEINAGNSLILLVLNFHFGGIAGGLPVLLILYISCVASRLRIATNERAEAEKILQVKRAEGEAESKYLSGVGVARQRQAIVDGLRESVLAFSSHVDGTSPKDVLDMVLLTQYFDTMKVCKPLDHLL